MCYGQLFEEALRRARKPHACHLCGAAISAGTRYVTRAGSYDGDFQFVKLCLACAATVDLEFEEAGPGVCIYFGEERSRRRDLVEDHGWRGALAILREHAKAVRERLTRKRGA